MFDLTLKEEDKDSYIVDVVMNGDGTYTVSFASGREEIYPFNIHNFQVELYRMEEQFSNYSKDYLDRVYPNGSIRTSILGMLLVVDIMAFKKMLDDGFTFSGVWCLIYGMYVLLSRGIPQIKQRKLFVEAKKKIALMKLYLEHKDEFKVDVINPHTGKEDDWYLVDLANIDQFDTEKELSDYLLGLTPDVKLEKSNEMSLRLERVVKSN